MTGINWADEVWNPVAGCTRVSAGCDNCYAATMSRRLEAMGLPKYQGLAVRTEAGRDAFNGVIRCLPELLDKPFHWRKPRKIFVNSMSDLFHKGVPDEFIDRVFSTMAICQQHVFQVLTKRPERMLEYCRHFQALSLHLCETDGKFLGDHEGHGGHLWEFGEELPRIPLPNVWLGTTVEDQAAASGRIPLLLDTPAAVRWLSVEPLLGNISYDFSGISWIVVGCESGHNRRPCRIEWVEGIVAQCQAANVPVWVKQLEIGGKVTGEVNAFPPHLRLREWPR